MTPRELERLEKDSIYTLKVNGELKDQIVQGYLNELTRVVKTNIRKKELLIVVIER
jgi:hypothetical protein